MLVLLAFLSVTSAAILKRDTAIPSLANQLPALENITALAQALLSNNSRPFQKGNMMGLGFLEVAMKDIVDLPCNGTYTVPSIGIYNYTQCQILNASGDVQNNATWQIDLGPLYDWAPRKSGKPYLDMAPALDHWQNVDTQSYEFIVALQFFGEYHYYVARNMEEYFFGQNSTYANITHTNPNVAYNATYIYQVAKGSTIRFAHALLQESVLQILLDNPTGDRELGFNHATFELWFRRDVASATGTASQNGAVLPSVRVNQEFPGDITRKNKTHHLLSALDWTLSFQNPVISTRYASNNDAPSCDGIGPRSELAYKVMNLLDTPVYRFGERIHPNFKKQTQLQLYRARELRLGSYKKFLDALNISSTAADDNCNVYSGSVKENNATRQYQMRIASAVMAAMVPISDAIVVDPFSYFRNDSNMYWNAGLFHPNSALLGDDTCCLSHLGQPFHDVQHISGFTYCYAENSECTVTAKNAGAALFGYHPDMSDADTPLYPYRSNGAFFSYPPDYPSLNPPDLNPLGFRQGFVWRTVSEFANTLYYNFDGLNTLALKQQGTDTTYLPNPILDSIPTNIGWKDDAYDCTCNTKLGPSCTRAAGNPIGEGMDCLWFGA